MANYSVNKDKNIVTMCPDVDKNGNAISYVECGIEGCPFEYDGKCFSKECICNELNL